MSGPGRKPSGSGTSSTSNFFTPIESIEPILNEGISRVKLPNGHLIIAAIYTGGDKTLAASYQIFSDIAPA